MTIAKETKSIKEKVSHSAMRVKGFQASSVSLLMKSDLKAPEQITEDVIKALQRVTVSREFRKVLRKFFYMRSDDAELCLPNCWALKLNLKMRPLKSLMMSRFSLETHSTEEWLEWRMESISIARHSYSGERNRPC